MNLDHIRTFLEVASCGNFHRASEALNVTQSTVSARIRTLEDYFGLPLFRRARSGVELTVAGHQFRRYALSIQQFWQQGYQALTLPRGYRAVFSIASQVSLWGRLVLPLIPWLRAEAPELIDAWCDAHEQLLTEYIASCGNDDSQRTERLVAAEERDRWRRVRAGTSDFVNENTVYVRVNPLRRRELLGV